MAGPGFARALHRAHSSLDAVHSWPGIEALQSRVVMETVALVEDMLVFAEKFLIALGIPRKNLCSSFC